MKKTYFLLFILLLSSLNSTVILDDENGYYIDSFSNFNGINSDSTSNVIYEDNALSLPRTTSFFATSQICYGVKEAGGSIYILATQDNTTINIFDINTGIQLNPSPITLNKGEKSSFGAFPDGTPFKVVADKPVNTSMINKDAGQPGAAFYPAYDTQIPMGKEFIFEAPFNHGNGRIRAFNPNTLSVNVIINGGSAISIPARSPYAFPQTSWTANQTMTVKSDLPITIEATSYGNSATTVPATDAENAGLGSGKEFYFVTDNSWAVDQDLRGAIVVYPYEDNVSITLTQIYDDGSSNQYFVKTGLERGRYYYYHGMDTNGTGSNSNSRFRLESDGIIEVWAGGVEFQNTYNDTVAWVGDDISYAGGRDLPDGKREYFTHVMTHKDYLLSPFDSVHVRLDTMNTDYSYTNLIDTLLNKDEWFSFGKTYVNNAGSANESYMAKITCSKPVFIMTSGGNQYNDWATNLPGLKLTTDNSELYTKAVTPKYLKNWKSISFSDSLSVSTLIYYQIEYNNSGVWMPINNYALPGNDFFDGNAFGFRGFNGRSVDSINISLLDTAVYKSIRLHAMAGTANKLDMTSNPRLNGWTVKWVAYGEPQITPPLADETVNFFKGEKFSSINLDNHVYDLDDDPSVLNWSISGSQNLFIYQTGHNIDSIKAINPYWHGSENIIYTVTDPDNYSSSDTVKYTVIKQNILINKTSINYGNIAVNSSKLDSFLIKNDGSDTLEISNISGYNSIFKNYASSPNSFSLAPGDSLRKIISFTPTTTNIYNTVIKIYSNDPQYPIKNIALTGRGVKPEISGPNTLIFGDMSLNSSKFDSVTISNIGNHDLFISSISGLDGSIFRYNGASSYNISAGNSIILPLEFHPINPGVVSDTLIIANTDDDENPFLIKLTGAGVNPTFSCNTSNINYGSVNISTLKKDTIEITNYGNDSLRILNTYGIIPPFEISKTIGNLHLDYGEKCKLVIDFDPSAIGNFTDTLYIASNDNNNSPYPISLSGSGIYQQFDISQNTLNFGTITNIENKTDSITIYNTGSDILQITEIINPTLPFTPQNTPSLPLNISPADSFAFKFNFTSADTGRFTDTLTIKSNDLNNLMQKVTLKGRSVKPVIFVSKTVLNFGKTMASSTKIDSFYIKNTGTSNLQINNFNLPSSPFAHLSPNAPLSLASNDSVFAKISFSPNDEGAFLDSINILSNDKNFTVKLTGIGIKPKISGINSINFPSILAGSEIDTTITITNTGSGDLILNAATIPNLPFTLLSPQIPPQMTLQPSENIDFDIKFSPLEAGNFSDTISINNNSFNQPNFEIILTGNATAPNISVKSSLSFGNLAVNSVSQKNIFIKNTGDAILKIISYNTPNLPFALLNEDPISILPNDSIAINLSFSPQTAEIFTDTLKIINNDINQQVKAVVLSGVGTLPQLSVVDTLKFLTVPGNTDSKQLLMTNSGSDNLLLNNISHFLNLPLLLEDSINTFPQSIAPTNSLFETISFSPLDGGIYQGEVQITSNDPTNPQKNVIVSAIGNGPEIETVDSLDFGFVQIYTQKKDTAGFYIKNEGVLDLNISSLSGFNSSFSLISPIFPISISPNDSIYVLSEFDPDSTLGAFGNNITINSNDYNEGNKIIKFKGYGYQGVGKIAMESQFQILNFGSVELLKDSLLNFIIKNIGDGPLFGQINYPPNFKGEYNQDSISINIAPLEENEYKVRFIPDVAGNYNSNLTIATNDTTADSVFVYPNLIGIGIEPVMTYLPSNILDFDSLRMYRLHTKNITVKNTGNAKLRVSHLSGISSAFKLINSSDSSFVLEPNEEKIINIGFYPSEHKTYKDTINFYYNHYDGSPSSFIVQGAGKYPNPKLVFDTSNPSFVPNLNFGNVILNQSKTLDFTIYNQGDSTLTGSFSPITSKFNLEIKSKKTNKSGIINFTIPENGDLDFTATFIPTILYQEETDTLVLTSNDDDISEFIKIPMKGTGVIDGASITVNPHILDFGSIHVDSTKTKEFTITNQGSIPLVGKIFSSEVYHVSNSKTDTLQYMIEPGNIKTIKVSFEPTAINSYNDSLIVISNDINFPEIKVSLLGESFGDGAAMIVNPDSLNFENVFINHDKQLSFNISNAGNDTLKCAVTDTPNLPFTSNNSANYNIPPSGNVNIVVTFSPDSVKSYLDSIKLYSSNSVINSNITIPLKGSGINIEPTIMPSSLDFDTTFVNQSKIDSFQIINHNGVDEFICFINQTESFKLEDGYNGYFTIPAGKDSTIKIIFTPDTGDTLYLDSLKLTSTTNTTWEKYLYVKGYSETPKPEISITPTNYNYGNIIIGKDSTFVLSVINTGTGTLTSSVDNFNENFSFTKIAKISMDAKTSHDNFAITNTDTINYLVKFTPTDDLEVKDSIRFISNSIINDTIFVPLAGKGYHPNFPMLFVSTDSLNFDSTAVGNEKNMQFFITNAGKDTLKGEINCSSSIFSVEELAKVSLLARNSKKFRLEKNNISFELSENDTIRLSTKFKPDDSINYLDSINISSNANNKTIYLAGKGYQADFPILFVSTDSLNFDSTAVGDEKNMQFFITNAGKDTLKGEINCSSSIFSVEELAKISLLSRNSKKFSFEKNIINFEITENDTIKLLAKFKPDDSINYLDSINISSNANNKAIYLAGKGYQADFPMLFVSTDSLNFDSTAVGNEKNMQFFITNAGKDTLKGEVNCSSSIFSVEELTKFSCLNSKKFRLRNNSISFEIAENDTIKLSTKFKPDDNINYMDSINISSNANISGYKTIFLAGKGYFDDNPLPVIKVYPDTLDFGISTNSTEKTFVIKNIGTADLKGNILFNSPIFNIEKIENFSKLAKLTRLTKLTQNSRMIIDSLDFVITPNDSAVYKAIFTPANSGEYLDSIMIYSNVPTIDSSKTIICKANVPDGNISIGDKLLFGKVILDSIKTDSVKVVNNSENDFICYGLDGFNYSLFRGFYSKDSLGFVVNAKDSAYIHFSFAPKFPMNYKDTIKVYTDSNHSSYYNIKLSGIGITDNNIIGDYLTITPLTYDYGLVEKGKSYNTQINFANTGDSNSVVGFDISYEGAFVSVTENKSFGRFKPKKINKNGKAYYYYYLHGGENITLNVKLSMNEAAMAKVQYGILQTPILVYSDATMDPRQDILLKARTEEFVANLESFGLISPYNDSKIYASGITFKWENNQADSISSKVAYQIYLYTANDTITNQVYDNLLTLDKLKINTNYTWNVKAKYGYLEKWSDDKWSFILKQKGDISPNPFTPDSPDPNYSRAKFVIHDNRDNIRVKIYSIGGKFIKLLSLTKESDRWVGYWNGYKRSGGKVAPGVYLYQVYSGNAIIRNGFIGVAR